MNLELNPYEPSENVAVQAESACQDATGDSPPGVFIKTILYFCILLGVYGARQVFAVADSTMETLAGLVVVVVLALWIDRDNRRRGESLASAMRLLVLVTCPLSTQIYLVRTRGTRGVGWFIFNEVLICGAIGIGFYLTCILVCVSGHWDLFDSVLVRS